MTDPYTPTTEQIRTRYIVAELHDCDWEGNWDSYLLWPDAVPTGAEFDRWLASHDATLRADVAREIRDYFYTDEHVGMSRAMAEMYEEIVSDAARIAEGRA